jgi:nucleoside-diphosphate-sugar epimerase
MTLPPTEKVCFVTGATGFVGLNLIDELLGGKWEVYGLHLDQTQTMLKTF